MLSSAAVRACTILAAAWLFAAPAAADDGPTDLEARKAALFQQMLRDPANLSITFDYVDVAVRLGDNEAAVSALERLLLFNPNLARINLELAVLYYRMSSFEAARSYLDKAAELNPPADVQARIDQYKAKITALDNPDRLSGYLFFGGQYQSNMTVSPGELSVPSLVPGMLYRTEFPREHGGNLFATGSAVYSHDLGTQDRDVFEVTGLGSVNHYFPNSHFDLDFGEVTAGPRLRYPDLGIPFVQWASLKPYAIVNESGLGEEQYFYTLGAGIEATAVLWGDLTTKLAYEFRSRNFTNAPDRPGSSGLSGNDHLAIFALKKPVTTNSVLTVEFDYLNEQTHYDYYANKTYSIAGSYHINYADPIGLVKLPWETEVFANYSWSKYNAFDPCCDVDVNITPIMGRDRYDRHLRYGITQTFPVSASTAVILQLQRDVVISNLPIYGYTNNTVVLGPQIRF